MNANPTTPRRFTVAELARMNNVNPKIARRRLRDAARKAAAPSIPARKDWTDGRLFWEFNLRQDLHVFAIITPAA